MLFPLLGLEKGTVLKLISWKHSFERLTEEYEMAKKKKQALDNLFETGRISQATRDSFDNDINAVIMEIEKQQKNLLAKMQGKAQELEGQIRTLETLLANYEIQHVVGEIDEEIYQREINLLSTGLGGARHELDRINEATNQLCPPIEATTTEPSLPVEENEAEVVQNEPVENIQINPVEAEVATEPCPQEPVVTTEEAVSEHPEILSENTVSVEMPQEIVESPQELEGQPQVTEDISQPLEETPSIIEDDQQVAEETPQTMEETAKVIDNSEVSEEMSQATDEAAIYETPEAPEDKSEITEEMSQDVEEIPQEIEDQPPITEDMSQPLEETPSVIEDKPQEVENTPEVTEYMPEVIENAPQLLEETSEETHPQEAPEETSQKIGDDDISAEEESIKEETVATETEEESIKEETVATETEENVETHYW
jgi:hypothetical protein